MCLIVFAWRPGHAQPLIVAANLVLSLQTIVSRNMDPFASSVVTVGFVKGGSAYNVIPTDAHVGGTTRTTTPEARKLIEKRIREICEGAAQMYGVKIDVEYRYGYPPTINNAQRAAFAIDVHNASGAWNKALLDNAARPSGALVYGARDGERLTGEQELAKMLEGRVAGEPVSCIPLHRTSSSRIMRNRETPSSTILYRPSSSASTSGPTATFWAHSRVHHKLRCWKIKLPMPKPKALVVCWVGNAVKAPWVAKAIADPNTEVKCCLQATHQYAPIRYI